ncbi:hypothetical protein PUNSTDRAFT_141392, partial [Punctularia strigosozonata HHB-11173 SS5]|uniref:uncharacterized protein n=1 Tax=Punctularia strigosozonata (strain HHB-11173) TaxID=741275 RepID=UPI0004416421
MRARMGVHLAPECQVPPPMTMQVHAAAAITTSTRPSASCRPSVVPHSLCSPCLSFARLSAVVSSCTSASARSRIHMSAPTWRWAAQDRHRAGCTSI